jgi:hypothetical protein
LQRGAGAVIGEVIHCGKRFESVSLWNLEKSARCAQDVIIVQQGDLGETSASRGRLAKHTVIDLTAHSTAIIAYASKDTHLTFILKRGKENLSDQ